MPGKGRAMGYSQYYKNNDNSDENNDEMKETVVPRGAPKKSDVDEAAERRKAAIQRRLRMRKAGK